MLSKQTKQFKQNWSYDKAQLPNSSSDQKRLGKRSPGANSHSPRRLAMVSSFVCKTMQQREKS